MPAGRSAIALRLYSSPLPAFGPGSREHERRQLDGLELNGHDESPEDRVDKAGAVSPTGAQSTYAGAGSYY